MADVELTAAQTRELMALDQPIQELRTLLLRAERAGLDVSELQRTLEQKSAQRIALVREFGAGTAARRKG